MKSDEHNDRCPREAPRARAGGFPFMNSYRGNLDDVHAMLSDAGGPILMLIHWVRDRTRGPHIPVEAAVRPMTMAPAALYGLDDRGRLVPGLRADVNVIGHAKFEIEPPEMSIDLPAGARRIMQRACGYHRKIVAGEITIRDDVAKAARTGRLDRGER